MEKGGMSKGKEDWALEVGILNYSINDGDQSMPHQEGDNWAETERRWESQSNRDLGEESTSDRAKSSGIGPGAEAYLVCLRNKMVVCWAKMDWTWRSAVEVKVKDHRKPNHREPCTPS